MKLAIDPRAGKIIKKLSESDETRVARYIDLFDKYGFDLPSQYLKKLGDNLWELRPGDMRLLFGWTQEKSGITIVHIFRKQSQKTPINDLQVAIKRLGEYG